VTAFGDIYAIDQRPPERIYGVVTGLVTNNQDPDKLGRVRVSFPWLSQGDESWWARIAAPMAGNQAGAFFLPEIDDEVLVAFEHGDVRYPYVIGVLWRQDFEPPADNADGKNALIVLRSRAGHEILLDDTQDEEQIVISGVGATVKVTLDAANKEITIEAEEKITVVASSSVTVEAPDVVIQATDGALSLQGATVEIISESALDITADGDVSITGSTVALSGDSDVEVGGGAISVAATGAVDIGGSEINLN
jgi:uncharacterized protein involved in type VI secretion and phage assembly